MKILIGHQRIAVLITLNVNCAAIEGLFSYQRKQGKTTHLKHYFQRNLPALLQVAKSRKHAKCRRAYSVCFTAAKIDLLYLHISAKQRIGLGGMGKDVKTNCKDRFFKSYIVDLQLFLFLKAFDTGLQFEQLGQSVRFYTVKGGCVNQEAAIGVKDTPMPEATSSASGSFFYFSSYGRKDKIVLDFFKFLRQVDYDLNLKEAILI